MTLFGVQILQTKFFILMKYILLFITLCCFPTFIFSQRQMLFPEFYEGTIFLKGNKTLSLPLNYDAGNQCMMYIQNSQDMIITNVHQIDSVNIQSHTFIPYQDRFCEIVSIENKQLYIDWFLVEVNTGYKGAFGQTTQAKVSSLQLNMTPSVGIKHDQKIEQTTKVYELKNRNTYYTIISGQYYSFHNKTSFLRLYPKEKESLKILIKKNKIDFRKTNDIIKLLQLFWGT